MPLARHQARRQARVRGNDQTNGRNAGVDLKAAGIAPETDSGIVDFHALRGTYVTHLVASGASVKTCQTLARHSTPSLTIGIYAKASLMTSREPWTPCPT